MAAEHLFEASAGAPDLTQEEWFRNVVAPVGQGSVYIGHVAINFGFADGEIITEFEEVLGRLREQMTPHDSIATETLTRKGPGMEECSQSANRVKVSRAL